MEPQIDKTIAVPPSADHKAPERPDKPKPFGFWIRFGLAMGLYALVMLSPRLAEREHLLKEIQSLNTQIEEDKSRISRLKVANVSLRRLHAAPLRNEHLQEEATIEQTDDGREIIPLTQSEMRTNNIDESELRISERPQASQKSTHWYAPVVVFLKSHPNVRGGILLGVVALILTSFSSAQVARTSNQQDSGDSNEEEISSKPQAGFFSRFLSRYQAKEEINLDELEQRLLALAAEEDEWQSDALPVDVDDDDLADKEEKNSNP